MRTAVRTINGNSLDLLDPKPDQIHIEDIAHHLAQLNRYNGGCPFPVSVAQHSLLVANLLPHELRIYGLLHDAAEAYLGDLVSPAKRIPELGKVFRPLEERVQNAIYHSFGLSLDFDHAQVKAADDAVMAVEMGVVNNWPDLVKVDHLPDPGRIKIEPRDWREVKEEFLIVFHSLALLYANQAA